MKSFKSFFSEQAAKSQIKPYNRKQQDALHNTIQVPVNKNVDRYITHSSDINSTLHNTFRGKKAPKKLRKIIHKLDGIMDDVHIPKDMYLFTGVPESPEQLWKLHHVNPRSPVTCILPAYTSCTTDYDLAAEWCQEANYNCKLHPPRNSDHPSEEDMLDNGGDGWNHVLKIFLPKGSSAGSVKKQGYSSEEEFLLHRDTIIEIDPKPTVTKDYEVVWYCKYKGRNQHHV